MKSWVSFLSIAGIFFLSEANTNAISVNPIQLFVFGMYNLEFEGSLGDRASLSVFFGITGSAYPEYFGVKTSVREQRIGCKFYPRAHAPSGFYVGPNLSLTTGNISTTDYSISRISALGLSAEVGYRWLLGKFAVAPFGGFGGTITNDLFQKKIESGYGEEIKLLPIFWYYGLKIGWAW